MRRGPILVSVLSLATGLAKRQAIQITTFASENRNKQFEFFDLDFLPGRLALSVPPQVADLVAHSLVLEQ